MTRRWYAPTVTIRLGLAGRAALGDDSTNASPWESPDVTPDSGWAWRNGSRTDDDESGKR